MTETIIMVMVPAKITRLSEAANYKCRVMATHVEDDSGVPLSDRVEWLAESALRTLRAEREDPESLMELMNEEA
jgi:hypothetical protein